MCVYKLNTFYVITYYQYTKIYSTNSWKNRYNNRLVQEVLYVIFLHICDYRTVFTLHDINVILLHLRYNITIL